MNSILCVQIAIWLEFEPPRATFPRLARNKNPIRIEKTAEELNEQDKKFLLGNLINVWDNVPPDVRLEFYKLDRWIK